MNSNIDNLQLQNAILMDEDYEGEELLLNMGPARSETLLVEPIDEDIVTEDAHPVQPDGDDMVIETMQDNTMDAPFDFGLILVEEGTYARPNNFDQRATAVEELNFSAEAIAVELDDKVLIHAGRSPVELLLL